MDTIIQWAKDNYSLISLIVGVVGILIGIISLYNEVRRKKESKREKREDIINKIEIKEAELSALESETYFFDSKTMNDTMIRKNVLRKEIERLRKNL